jgi:hypothetical protein
MNRVWVLTLFLVRDVFHSLAGAVPLAAGLAFGIIAFEYGMDQAQFITVAGIGIGAICMLTTVIISNRANRGASYLLLARLHRRAELLVALALSGMGITAMLAILITAGNLFAGRLELDFPPALWILPTWLPLWLLAASLALPLSALVERGGSHLAGYALLAALLIANDRSAILTAHGLDWLVRVIDVILWPPTTLLAQASAGIHDRLYVSAWLFTLGYAALLFGLAASFLADKDLLWSE